MPLYGNHQADPMAGADIAFAAGCVAGRAYDGSKDRAPAGRLKVAANPAEAQLVEEFGLELNAWPEECGRHLAVFGSGGLAGAFSMLAARSFPSGSIIHVKGPVSSGISERKTAEHSAQRAKNLRMIHADPELLAFRPESLSAAVSAHALYALHAPQLMLKKMHGWLMPGGMAYLCDLGRVLKVGDWWRSMLRDSLGSMGWLPGLQRLACGHGLVHDTWRTAALQRQGRYWTHSHEQFLAAVEAAGFEIRRHHVTYRGCSDVVVAVKK